MYSQSNALLTAEGRCDSVFCTRTRTLWRPSSSASLNSSATPECSAPKDWQLRTDRHKIVQNSIYNIKIHINQDFIILGFKADKNLLSQIEPDCLTPFNTFNTLVTERINV